jgi:uncharacterized membrane protein YcaP (DUF421 family)
MFFESWMGLARVLIIGSCAYVALITLLRISGKRTLSKMNAFDFIITVAFGSTLATVLLSKDVPLAEGVLGFALLVMLQFIVTWSSVRSQAISRVVKSTPTLLVYCGEFQWQTMKAERVNRDEILAAIRSQGISRIEAVGAVVLETDGSFSVLQQVQPPASSALDDIAHTRG